MNIALYKFLGDRDEALVDGRFAIIDDCEDRVYLMLNDPPENYIFDVDALGEYPNDIEKHRATFTTRAGLKVEISLIS